MRKGDSLCQLIRPCGGLLWRSTHLPIQSPEAHPLLEYRFIDLASTQTILARIKGIPQPNGGGQLAFETNAGAAATSQRMLIDHDGNVGIGTGNPGASLDVAGDARFSGPLSVQGALKVEGCCANRW